MACEDRLGVEVALGRRLAAEGVGLVGHADVQGVTVEVGVDGHRGDAELAAGPDHPDGDFAAVCNEDLLEHAGLSSVRRAITIARTLWCLPCGAGSGTSTGSTRSTRPTPMSVTRPATGRPPRARRGGRPPDAPAGVASTAAGSRRRGRTCWPRCSSGPDCDGRRTCTCAPGRWRWPAADACREVAGVEPGAQVAQRPAGATAPSWPASWPRRSSPGPACAAVVVGIGINVAWPGPPEAGGTCLDDVGGTAQPVDRRVLLERLLDALDRPACPARRARPGGEPWPTRCAGAAPRWARTVRVTWPARSWSGVASGHRRRRPPGGRDGRGPPARQRRRRGAPAAPTRAPERVRGLG